MKILLVDDEPVVLQVATDMIQMFGHDVDCVESGEVALENIRSHSDEYDLIILDLIMPGLSGAVCLKKIREINEEIPIVLSSGVSGINETKSIREIGANDYLQKPYNLKSLRLLLEKFSDQ